MIRVGVIGSDSEAMEKLLDRAEKELGHELEIVRFDGVDLLKQSLKAVAAVDEGKIDILFKGMVPTRTVLKAVLDERFSLNVKPLLSHIAVIHLPAFERLLMLTDAGMNIQPSLDELKMIIDNAIDFSLKMGIKKPQVALLSAAEQDNPKMQSAVNAKKLTKTYASQTEAIVYGPLSLDLALSEASVRNKNFQGPVAGKADILVVPTIEAGNIFYKALQLFTDAKIGGFVLGAKVPIIISSRSDSIDNKLFALKQAIQLVKGSR